MLGDMKKMSRLRKMIYQVRQTVHQLTILMDETDLTGMVISIKIIERI